MATLSIRAAADLLGVSVVTLRRWDRDGSLVAQRRPGGTRTYLPADVERFKAARAGPSGRATNLRPPPTSFIGRTEELAALARRFEEGARVVTIVGPPGVGKTRLAVEHALHTQRPTWFSDLSGASSLDQVCAVIERDLGLAGAPQRSTGAAVDHLVASLARRPSALLVLDNLEQITLVMAPFVARLARELPELLVLSTSRERLRIAAEVVVDLPPLDLRSDAAALFVARAAGKCDAEDPAIKAIVQRLDGIPLAIELAAARLGVLEPRELLLRLGDRLLSLPSGPRDAAARQSTLRDAIDWSWRLLGPAEQSALAQCSVFRGGFSVEAAEHVVDLSAVPGAPAVVDVLSALLDRSLLRSDREPVLEERRLSLIMSIAEYAAHELGRRGGERGAEGRHASFFVTQGRRWSEACEGPDERLAMHRLAIEEANILAVVNRAQGTELSIEAVTLLEPMLWRRGCLDAHFDALARAVDRAAQVAPELHGLALRSLARARIWRGDPAGAERDALLGIQLAPALEASLRRVVSTSLHRREKLAEAVTQAERALALDELQGDRRGEGTDLMLLGGILLEHRDSPARGHLERALPILREVGRPTHEGICRMYLGMLHHDEGRLDEARRILEGAAKLLESDPRRAGYVTGLDASVLYEQGHLDMAIEEYERALAILDDAPWPPYDALLRARLGVALADSGGRERAARELSRAETNAAGAAAWVEHALALHRAHVDPDPRPGLLARPPPHDQYELRLAYRWLLARSTTSRDDALVIGANGQWFRPPRGERVDIGHRKPLCRILSCLAGEGAQHGVSIARLVERGWPGERVVVAAGAKRVRVAIATLREFGLRDLVVRGPDGYALAPGLAVRVERDHP